jgi:hypothetical protein
MCELPWFSDSPNAKAKIGYRWALCPQAGPGYLPFDKSPLPLFRAAADLQYKDRHPVAKQVSQAPSEINSWGGGRAGYQ